MGDTPQLHRILLVYYDCKVPSCGLCICGHCCWTTTIELHGHLKHRVPLRPGQLIRVRDFKHKQRRRRGRYERTSNAAIGPTKVQQHTNRTHQRPPSRRNPAVMSLATPSARDGVRPVSFLPTIKCSTCHDEIEIAAMGDHVCAGKSAEAPPPPPPKSRIPNLLSSAVASRQYSASEQPLPALPQGNEEEQAQTQKRAPVLNKKPSRIALPKINATAANQSYLSPQQRRLDTPLTTPETSGERPSFQRSLTSPMPRLFDPRPPSPELSANLDCAFPPFLASGSSTPVRPPSGQGRRTPGSDRDQSRSRAEASSASRNDHSKLTVDDSYIYGPKSPRKNGGESVLQKLNTLKSGPFTARRQDSAESKDGAAYSTGRRPSAPELQRKQSSPASHNSYPHRPTTPGAGKSPADVSRIPKKVAPSRPTRNPSEDLFSPAFLEQFSAEPVEVEQAPASGSAVDGSSTCTTPEVGAQGTSESHMMARQRSEPGLRSLLRRPSLAHATSAALPLPPRSQSRNGARVDHRMQDAPPVPKPVLQHRQQQSSLHTPSESGSTVSTAQSSDYSDTTYSTRPSPVGSVEALSVLLHGLEDEERMRPAGLNVRNQQKPGERAELPREASPPRYHTRPAAAPAMTSAQDRGGLFALESPMDPALLPRLAIAANEPWVALPEVLPLNTSPERKKTPVDGPRLDRTLNPPALSLSTEPPVPEQAPPKRHHMRRPTNGNKATCRGCGLMIEGKSVKAADGRLTGRWHKACFVCRSCQAPFLTADFYVIDNQPYCEHHYHEQNGSLCHGCHRGIEGQYLETTSATTQGIIEKKYHPRCFTCSQCRITLTDDYFEISNRIYCERHALAAMRVQAHAAGVQGIYPTDQRSIMAERRTTRLINPIMA